MQIFNHFSANNIRLEPFPFKRELAMEAYLIENESVLSLDSGTFSNIDILEVELPVLKGRKKKNTDGRIDILATYSQEYLAVIELKLGELNQTHLDQLEDYLKAKDEIIKKRSDIVADELKNSMKWIGVLVGSSISNDLSRKIEDGYNFDNIPIAAIVMQRYRSTEGNVYVTSSTYFGLGKSLRDSTKYIFEDITYGKGRLVLAVIKRLLEQKSETTINDLRKIFPDKCQGPTGVFRLAEDANKIFESTGYKRHFINPGDILTTSDGSKIAICNQWGVGNKNNFIELARKANFKIDISK